jgi:Fe-S cluster assembly protein SufD
LQVARDRQIADLHSLVRFEGPEGQLDQLQKAVVDDAGRSVFHGAVQVPQAAQRTNASQLSRNLLLSDRARVDAIPQLEIVADDVRCTHGATVTRLQQEELFYLRSRGLGADQAARLLLAGFCDEILASLPASASRWDPAAALLGSARPR